MFLDIYFDIIIDNFLESIFTTIFLSSFYKKFDLQIDNFLKMEIVKMDILHFVTTMNNQLVEMPGSGLTELWNNVLRSWITPLYVAFVAAIALLFLKDRAWMKLIGFVGIAAVVGVLVFAGGDLFGGKDKGLTKVGVNAAKDINIIDGTSFVPQHQLLENNFSK